jgi:NAD(P)-dependent dehydrogenase (short-subunit alcohol dehydrogenase family)
VAQGWTGVRGKRVVITGATNGIGLAAAARLSALGAELTIVARSPERAAAAATRIGGRSAPPDVLIADLSSQAAVRALARQICERYARVEVLINNAGAVYSTRQLTSDGIEQTWAVNHLAPFLLTRQLLPLLQASAPARIITTASGAHRGAQIPFDDLNAERGYASMGMRRYGQTKLANILFTVELASRLKGTGVTANCFHPGFVDTGFGVNNGGWLRMGMLIAHLFARRPAKGAETLVWLADAAELDNVSGGYFMDKRMRQPSQAAHDRDAALRLWQVSDAQVAAHA